MKNYISGEEKILDEAKESADLSEHVVEYLTQRCDEDLAYNAMVVQPHKSWKRCSDYLTKQAKKLAGKGSQQIMVEAHTVFHWIDEYYSLDDKAEVEAELRKKEETEKKAKERKKKVSVKSAKKSDAETVKASDDKSKDNRSDQAIVKPKGSDIDGQIDLFSLLTA